MSETQCDMPLSRFELFEVSVETVFPPRQDFVGSNQELACFMASQSPRHVLRGILRRLRTNVDLVGGDSSGPIREYVLRASRKDPKGMEEVGRRYAVLQRDLQERARLLALDTGAEVQLSPMEMSRRAAARAGLQLPKLDSDVSTDLSEGDPAEGKSN